jgi:hypothetical protein
MRCAFLLLVLLSPLSLQAQALPESPHPKRELIEHIALTAAGEAFAMLDSHSTRVVISHHGRELDPLQCPFVGSGALYAEQAIWSLGLGYLGWRMHHSHNRLARRFWWLPQIVQLEGSVNSWRHNNLVIARDLREGPGDARSLSGGLRRTQF